MTINLDHAVKVRKAGEKTFAFLTHKGGTNKLRVHAALFSKEQAEATAAQAAADNPGYEFKAVRL